MIAYHRNLDPSEQARFGITDPAPLAEAGRVQHDELDALNHVNNTVYMVWFERLRIRFMEHYGLGALDDAASPRIVIRSGQIHWKHEMQRGQDYVVTTRCTGLRRTSFSLQQCIWAEARITAQFDCVMVLLAPDGRAKHPISQDIRAQLMADGAKAETA
jgi:acyl-CoA thioester hydrolase